MFILNKGFCSVKNSENFIENEISLGKQSSRKLRVWRESERMIFKEFLPLLSSATIFFSDYCLIIISFTTRAN